MRKHSFPSGNSRAQALERATLALMMQRFDEAEHIAADILRASRTDTAAASILAQALMAQNRSEEAVAPLEKAARRSGDVAIETLLGAALSGAGRWADAIVQLRRTSARRPPFLPAFQELAGQLAKAGQYEEAITTVEGGLALAPESIDLRLDLARLNAQRNARGKARKILLQAREAAPGRIDILIELARLLLLDGDYVAAASAYHLALRHNPDDALTRADLATCLLEMGEREAGEVNLRLALRGRPQLLGRTIFALAKSSHGRFFFRPSAAAKFLQKEKS